MNAIFWTPPPPLPLVVGWAITFSSVGVVVGRALSAFIVACGGFSGGGLRGPAPPSFLSSLGGEVGAPPPEELCHNPFSLRGALFFVELPRAQLLLAGHF